MNKYLKTLLLVASFFAIQQGIYAQSNTPAPASASEPAAIIMISITVLLIAVILILSQAVFTSYEIYKKKNKDSQGGLITLFIVALLSISSVAGAQDTEVVQSVGSKLIGGLSQTSFYLMLSVIILELIIIIFLARTFTLFSGLRKSRSANPAKAVKVKEKKKWAWFEKLNNTKSLDADSEAQVNLGHDYDGIGELDNPTPPWWQWGFVISILFAFVYMYVHHISKTAPLQIEELSIANVKAEKQLEQYLLTAGNNVDENTVTLLTDPSDILAGKSIFTSVCAACHAVDGGGIVGPNLTDKYWLHGGSVKEIFHTIKYGVPEKGMKSWKDDYSAKQIAQITSYIHTLQGTKPANPKAEEGELQKEDATVMPVVETP